MPKKFLDKIYIKHPSYNGNDRIEYFTEVTKKP